MTDVDLYINFVLHAIYGRLSEADTLMRFAGPQIKRVAGVLNARYPVEPKLIYRGALLDPSEPFKLDPKLTFLSWSEDRDVARWFAATGSMISAPLIEEKPELRGHMFTREMPHRKLFHYSWAAAFGRLETLALMHPMMGGEGARQIMWSLQTQREVITEPFFDLVPEPIDIPSVEIYALDQRLAPPWAHEENFS